MTEKKHVAVVGATGAVGRTMLKVLERRAFPVISLKAFASSQSMGGKIRFGGGEITVETIEPGCFEGVDIALFSAGGKVSGTFAKKAVEEGAIVIDNTSAFRYDDDVPLVIPEVNRKDIFKHKGLIANPNCSTIQMLVALKPLHDAARLKRIIVSTYQAVSGAGGRAVDDMLQATREALEGQVYESAVFPHPVAFNALPQIDVFLDDGWTREEMKMLWETHKIMDDPTIVVTATCVRIPVKTGHSESICAEFERPLGVDEARELWGKAPGVEVVDDPTRQRYPMALLAAGTDPVYVGRIRADPANDRTINFWCVADNLLKGAALNAVQIAECLCEGE